MPADLRHLGGRPLVYATFGTVFNDARLLSMVVNAISSLPVSVVATVGLNNDPAMLGDQPTHVHVAQFVPQDDLLSHCAAVVSHGGSGTFLASLARGLPQLLLPQGADQFLNADAGESAGVAIVLRPHEQEPLRCGRPWPRFWRIGAFATGLVPSLRRSPRCPRLTRWWIDLRTCESGNHAQRAPGWTAEPRPGPRHETGVNTPPGHRHRSRAPAA